MEREQWTDVKDNLGIDFPNLPYLIHEGLNLTEPIAIMQYIALRFAPDSVGGVSIEEKAEIDMLAYTFASLMK